MRGSVEPPAVAGVMLGRARVTSPEDAIEQEVAAIRAKRHARHGRGHDLEDEIEAQVAAVRAAKRGVAPGVARADAPPVVAAAASCPSCNATVTNPVAAFCSKCGASLREKCPTCGATVDGGDEFCSACGTSLVGGNGKVGKTVLGGANA